MSGATVHRIVQVGGSGPLVQAMQLEAAVLKTVKSGVDQQNKLALQLIESAAGSGGAQTPAQPVGDVGRLVNIKA